MLDHPDTVRDRRVLDIASGSGLVGIAAMKAGAVGVTVSDIDAFAIAAAELNAEVKSTSRRAARTCSTLNQMTDGRPSSRATFSMSGTPRRVLSHF